MKRNFAMDPRKLETAGISARDPKRKIKSVCVKKRQINVKAVPNGDVEMVRSNDNRTEGLYSN